MHHESKTSPLDQFAARLEASLAEGTFVRVVLSGPVPGSTDRERVLARIIELRGAPQLSFTFRYPRRDETRNLGIEEGRIWIRNHLGTQFRNALLSTTKRDWQLHIPAAGEPRLVGHKASVSATPSQTHDQPRHTLLDDAAKDWLRGLGVMDADGRVRASMADKYRQIGHFLEIFSHLARDCGWEPGGTSDHRPEITIADMGCGKAYLTFGMWHLLRRAWHLPARVTGVETRPELVASIQGIARQVNATGLEFKAGDIASVRLDRVDGLIALHACNTATDAAIQRGVELGARLIMVAPCCHQELRSQLGQPEPLAPILRHGLFAERMAEWLTDGLRALYLEWAGYQTKAVEFVGSEHTPKNLMLAAVRSDQPVDSEKVRAQIESLKSFFGLKHHALDRLLERRSELSSPHAVA